MLKRLEISAPRLKIRRQPLSKREAAHSSRADWAGRSLLCSRASADPVYLLQGASCAPVEFPPNAELVGAILTQPAYRAPRPCRLGKLLIFPAGAVPALPRSFSLSRPRWRRSDAAARVPHAHGMPCGRGLNP